MSESQLPSHIKQYYEKAVAALSKKNYEYAAELLFNVICMSPGFTQAREKLRIAQKALLEDPSQKSKQGFMNKIKSSLELSKASFKEKKGDIEGAIVSYEKALFINPLNKNAAKNLAKALAKAKHINAAIQVYESLSEGDTADISSMKDLGFLYSSLGDYEKSRKFLEKALEADPSDREISKKLKDIDALGTIKKSFEENK